MSHSEAVSELEVIFSSRQFAYDMLRRFFIEEPSREYVNYFYEENLIDLFPFQEDVKGIREGVADIREYLSAHDVVRNDEHYENLHWDYTRMFIGPEELPAPPWESVYVRKDRLLFQENTMAVRQAYQNFGYEINYKNLEAEDHVGLELDFMFHLNELCIENRKKKSIKSQSNLIYLIEEQIRFLEKHLLAFSTPFSEKVMESAQTSFYAGMAKIFQSFLDIDSVLLQELLEMVRSEQLREESI